MEERSTEKSQAEPTREEQERQELEAQLDEAIELTFPASDPIAVHPRKKPRASK